MTVFYETRDENLFIGEMTRYPYPLHVHEIVELACVTRGEVTMQIDEARGHRRGVPADSPQL